MPDLLAPLDLEVSALTERAEVGGITVEDIFLVRGKCEVGIKRLKELKDTVDALAIVWMPANNIKEFVAGPMRFYVSNETERDALASNYDIFEALLKACEGELKRVCDEALCASPFKVGKVKELVGEKVFDTLYAIRKVHDLKGVPVKKLNAADSRFVK